MTYLQHELTNTIIECIIKVHKTLGPGFLESIYRNALKIELQKRNLNVEMEREFLIYYDSQEVGCHRLDILVENRVILELKTVNGLDASHYAQVRSYLKATNRKLALLVNFSRERADFRRIEL